jgi:hypothetical protein
MRRPFQLAAAALLFTTAAALRAQITDPNKLVAPPPRNPARAADTQPTDNLQWLWQYAQPGPIGNKAALLEDIRFNDMLANELRAPQSMWGIGTPLADAAEQFLAGPGTITSTGNRYLAITGCVSNADNSTCAQRGLLFIDLGGPQPLIVFNALRWTEQSKTPTQPGAPFNLWLFPSRPLDAQQLPAALKDALNDWANGKHNCNAPVIANALLVDPSGVPHIIGTLDTGIHPTPCTTPGTHS